MKRFLFLVLVLVMVSSVVLAGCGKTETTTVAPTTAKPVATTTAAAPPPTTPAATKPATTPPPVVTSATSAPLVTQSQAPTTTAAPPTTPAPIKPTGTLRVALTDFSYESMDPIYFESFWGWSMYDSLITWDDKGTYVGNVAQSWSISPDGNTWTFKIRKDIKFHNGDPLTAADVKFSVDRFGSDTSTNPWSHYLATSYNKKSSAVIDDYTFQYVTDHPEPALVIPFAWTRILPKKYYESVGQEQFRKKPVGSGPWKFVEHVPETSFKMEANTAHWKQVPKYQFVTFVQVPEEATQVAMIKNNEVDIIGVSMDRIVQLQKDGFKAVELGLPTLANISFQGTWLTKAGATHDIRVRQAMSYSLNRQEICDTFYKGNAVPGGRWFMHPGGYGWDNSWKPDAFDLPKAKALLKEANYPAAFPDPTIHVYVSPGPNVDFMQLCQGYWAEAGLKIKIEIVDSVVFGGYFFSFKRLTGTEPNTGWIFPWIFASTQNSIYHASNMFGSWGAHNTGNDPKADELYKKATAELDPVKAQKYWTEFEDYAYTMWVNVGICMIKPLMVVSKNVGDFTTATNISLYDAFAGIQKPK